MVSKSFRPCLSLREGRSAYKIKKSAYEYEKSARFRNVVMHVKCRLSNINSFNVIRTVNLLTIDAIALKAACPMFRTRPKTRKNNFLSLYGIELVIIARAF